MRFFRKILILAIFFIFFIFINAIAEQKIIKVQTISPVEVKKTADIESKITGLTKEAIEAGLTKVVLEGSIKYEEIDDKNTRAKVEWTGVSIREGTRDKTRALTSPLVSQFSTDDERVEPNTELSAEGDFEKLLEDILELTKEQEKPKHLVEKTVEEISKGNLSPDYSSGSGNGRSAGEPGGDGKEFSVDRVSTSWELCSPRVAKEEGLVYRQAREVKTGESGNIIEQGACQDYGGTVPIVRDYNNNCEKIKDFKNDRVYYQYIEYAEVDGLKLDISGCTNDFADYAKIQAIAGNCGYRHDFETGVSIVQEKLYYKNKGDQTVYITECQDSDTKYQQYQTESGCSPVIDTAQGIVIPQSRVAYKIGGVEYYASECRASEKNQYEIKEGFCDPKYEHDFVNNVSYYRTYDYYVDYAGEVKKINECSRSASASFPHTFETSDCGVQNNDELMQTQFRSKRQIETPDGVLEISECQDTGVPVVYLPISTAEKRAEYTKSGEYNFAVPVGITKVYVTISGGDGGSTSGYYKSINCQSMGEGQFECDRQYIAGCAGKSGEKKSQTLTVKEGETISIVVGAAGKDTAYSAGQESKFGNYISTAGGAFGRDFGGGNCGSGAAGTGQAGEVIIKWYETDYKRGDGSIYDPQGN